MVNLGQLQEGGWSSRDLACHIRYNTVRAGCSEQLQLWLITIDTRKPSQRNEAVRNLRCVRMVRNPRVVGWVEQPGSCLSHRRPVQLQTVVFEQNVQVISSGYVDEGNTNG